MANSFGLTNPEKGYLIIHILVMLFGISAWIGVNGIFIQLPVLINVSPEGWNLPAYVVLIVQAANIGPVAYTILQYLRFKLNEPMCILFLLSLGTLATGFLMFFYSKTTTIAGTKHSLVLFCLIFCNALVGCFSSVLFIPYLQDFNKIYLVSYFIGEGLSGVLPSVIALAQGIGGCSNVTDFTVESPISGLKFSTRDYFALIFAILILSLVAFIMLQYSPFVQTKKCVVKCQNVIADKVKFNQLSVRDTRDPENRYSKSKFKATHGTEISKARKLSLFLLLGLLSFLCNGFFPSIQSYSCLPYGILVYKVSIILAQFANPIACFLALWFLTPGMRTIGYLSVICLMLGSYVTYLASVSPNPPLRSTELGQTLVIFSWTILIGVTSYLKLIIVSVFRSTNAPKILSTVGAIMQAGSAIGAIFSFVVINFTNTFQVYNKCVLASD